MAHVLIPTDLSTNAFNAASYAVQLYGAEENVFTLLHTFLVPVDPVTGSWSTDAAIAESSQAGLEAMARQLRNAFPGGRLDLRLASLPGELGGAVIGIAEQEAPDLVVMGTQGATGLQEVLLGTHTADVIKRSGLPVLAVPQEASYTIPRRMVIADDGGPVDRATVKVLLDVARWSKAELTIVHVTDDDEEVGGSAFDELLGAIPRSYHTISNENVTEALNTMADQSDADMVVVVHRQRSLFDRLFHRSTAARLAMHTHIPMLVLQHGHQP